MQRVTALISGTGSNLQALIDARRSGRLPVEIGHVISNRADAAGLQRAAEAGIRCSVLEPGGFSSRESYDTALAEQIEAGEPHLVVLVGFMRILGDTLVNRFHGRLINLHPSLLPLYRGTNTYVRALQAGDRAHGASMHFVTAELDGGPVVSQVRIPILPNDDASRLAARLSPCEHQLVVATVELFARHVVECRDDSVYVDRLLLNRPLQLEADGSLAP